jgi:hypothetical protein
MTPALFLKTVRRALRFRVESLETLRNIAQLYLTTPEPPLPMVDIDETFRQRDAYQEGRLTDTPDFSTYDQMLEDPDDE